MAVRKDSVQIDISFITDENRQFAKINQANRNFIRDLRKTKKEGGDLTKILSGVVSEGEKLEKLDLSKVAPAELIARGRQLRGILQQIPETAPGAAKLRQEYKRINDQLAKVRSSTKGVVEESRKFGGVLGKALGVFGGISLAGIASGVLNIGRNIIRTSTNFQKFEAVLTNALGDQSEAQRALKQLQDFAAETPFQLEELTDSYIKLVNRGLKPTQDDLRLLGDIAASQGKEFNQLVEAVLDAGTEEFERLKEFGIRAKKDGDTVQLAFKGITKEVDNSQQSITKAILEFGKFEGVLGSTEAISRIRAGRISNLADQITQLFNNLGSGYLGRVFDLALGGIEKIIGGLVDLTEEEQKASDSTIALQASFNAQIETLKRGNISTENRKRLIEQINIRYGEYLPNLLTEKSTLQEITAAQDAANKSFRDKILILSTTEVLQENNIALIKAQREELKLQEQLSLRQAQLQKAREEDAERARKNLPSTDNRATNQVNAAIRQVNAAIAENSQVQQQLQREFELSVAAAQKFGINIEEALSGSSGGLSGGGGPSGGGTGEKALDTRLKGIEAFFERQQLLNDRALLELEITESDHGKRLLELQQQRYQQQIDAYELYNESQSTEAERARNELIQIEQTLNRGGASVPLLGQRGGGQVQRRGINAGLDEIAANEESQIDRLRRQFEKALIAENQYSLAKLELRRMTLEQEIELLRQGTEEEVRLAAQKAEQIKEVDVQLAEERRRIAEAEAAARRDLNKATLGFFSDSLQLGIELLGKDEEARKKNIKVIKAFEKGRVIASGISEVQQIWAGAAQFGPLQAVIATVQSLAATVRTAAAIAKIDSAKFKAAKGIAIGNFGGNLHSQGGTKGYFEDGTSIEVERDEKFVVLNRRSSAMLDALSQLNVMGGGLSFSSSSDRLRYNTGGIVPVNTTPGATVSPSAGGSGIDFGAMITEFRAFRSELAAYPSKIRTFITYDDLETAASDVSTVRATSSV